MKIQHLAIIFLLIILPIDIVLGLYLDAQINTIRNQAIYDRRLVDCVYDALEVYQANSIVDTENDVVTAKMENIEASASTYLASLQSSFGLSGYKASVMQEYIPAVVYTMYDGYYIYSKYYNTLSQKNVRSDSTYTDGALVEGIKSYVFYSCRYQQKKTNGEVESDFVITYSLDNYIRIQGDFHGIYADDSGYLMDGITKGQDYYEYDGVKFYENGDVKNSNNDYMDSKSSEYIGPEKFDYVKINGTKYYLDEVNEEIFHLVNGTRVTQVSREKNETLYNKYTDAIKKNKSAYLYYKEAYEFTNKIRGDFNFKNTEVLAYGLSDLKSSDAGYYDNKTKKFVNMNDYGNYEIFKKIDGKYIQDSDSDFNQHRKAVIRQTIETNLSAAIAGFSEYSEKDIQFAMPKISEEDWETIENNVSVIGFLQGLDIGTKKYNGYAVSANTTTNEFVDENSIYIATDKQYHRANARDIPKGNNLKGVFKLDFEKHYVNSKCIAESIANYDVKFSSQYAFIPLTKYDINNDSKIDIEDALKFARNDSKVYYFPILNDSGDIYTGSYTSIVSQTSVDTSKGDMYKYMREGIQSNYSDEELKKIKETYYTALARERYGSYKITHDTDFTYYLNNYE